MAWLARLIMRSFGSCVEVGRIDADAHFSGFSTATNKFTQSVGVVTGAIIPSSTNRCNSAVTAA